MSDISKLILKKLVSDEGYCRKALPFIKAEYFEGDYKVIYKLILSFMTRYNSLPNCSAIEYAFGSLEHQTDDPMRTHKHIRDVFTLNADDEKIDTQWILEETEKWCKDRSIYLAVIKSINIIDGKDEKHDLGAIPDILSRALNVSFDRSVGHDYMENAEQRWDFYHTKEDKIPFDIEMLNKITKGGVPKKTLNVIMGVPGGGKSLVLCHLAASMLAQSKNVLYITMEMAEERIAERIDANLFDVEIQNIWHLNKKEFGKKMETVRKKSHGKLIIKEFPTAAAHVGHFRALIDELKIKKGFVPDVIFIDYLNICASSRLKSIGGSVNTYSYVKAIAEEVRGLAIEYGIQAWSATQTNRSGISNTDIDMTNMSESIGLAATADMILSIISTEELDELEQIMFKQIKNRYNDVTKYKRFVVGIDRSKMRLYDIEDTAQQNVMNEVKEFTSQSNLSSYEGFKM